jgi:hypothetical protein
VGKNGKSGKGGEGKDGQTPGEPGFGDPGAGQGGGERAIDPNDPDSGFRAENVKGKLDPKGRLTVTTFRGLPKPGEVTVELREALERARDEAQAPLESEEIPRRYREGIRDYFDDLGKTK